MNIIYTIAGLCVIAITLREIFRDLFQPSGTGALSSFLGRALFGFGRRFQWLLPITGPLTIVGVISVWTLLITIGFGFIYWPHFPHDFQQPTHETTAFPARIWSVLYFSLASLTTLASGGVSPQGSWLRMCTAIESLIGIGLITASVTWIVLIYPALGRMRTIARLASIISRTRGKPGTDFSSSPAESLLGDFAQRLVRTRIDFIHFPLIYYFHADTEGSSLAYALMGLLDLAREEAKGKEDEMRFSALMLEAALTDFAELLAEKFLRKIDSRDPCDVFRAVAEDHLQRNADRSRYER